MTQSRDSGGASGNIYDLGYRGYTGERLGRANAILTLYLYTLRGAFGLGRRPLAKIAPFGLVILALFPAVVQLGVSALTSGSDVAFPSFIEPVNYYGYVQTIVALFCAAVAPEIVSSDQRTRVLSLYFSRGLLRRDYVLAKFGALATAILTLTVLPVLILFVGNVVSAKDTSGYLKDHLDDLLPIVTSGLLISAFMSGISLVVASRTSRRAFASGGVFAAFILTFAIVHILIRVDSGGIGRVAVFFSPFHVARGTTVWLFRQHLSFSERAVLEDLYRVNWNGFLYGAVVVAVCFAAFALLVRRYHEVSV